MTSEKQEKWTKQKKRGERKEKEGSKEAIQGGEGGKAGELRVQKCRTRAPTPDGEKEGVRTTEARMRRRRSAPWAR